MKRFHVHVSVENLDQSIDFYSKLFGQKPTKEKEDYAKWMLEDPRVNFAISTRGKDVWLDHFGFQVENAGALQELKQLAENASNSDVRTQESAVCCYANSEKHWTIDPQGIAWEHFHTLSEAKTFGSDKAVPQESGCCVPPSNVQETNKNQTKKSACGPVQNNSAKGSSCC